MVRKKLQRKFLCIFDNYKAYKKSVEKLKKQGKYVNVDLNYEYLWLIVHSNEKYNKMMHC
jgi:hypothetical protein